MAGLKKPPAKAIPAKTVPAKAIQSQAKSTVSPGEYLACHILNVRFELD